MHLCAPCGLVPREREFRLATGCGQGEPEVSENRRIALFSLKSGSFHYVQRNSSIKFGSHKAVGCLVRKAG